MRVRRSVSPSTLNPRWARSDHPLDLDAAALEEGLMNRWFLDPPDRPGYPDDLRAVSGR